MKNRYMFIGSVAFSAHCLRALLKMGVQITDIMCPHKEAASFNSDYFDLGIVAKDFAKNVRYFNNINQEAEYIKSQKPDIILIFGLSQIIPKRILDIPSIGCIGSHPALLPKNRGRHPIIWSLVNGDLKSGMTFFWMDEGIDSGDIWAQEEFSIDSKDDATAVYEKVNKLSEKLLKKNIMDLEKGIITRKKQDHSLANYRRKRTSKDGEINWNMPSKNIYNLIRGLTKPYVGAHSYYKQKEFKIWKANITEIEDKFKSSLPGKVILKKEGTFVVKTADGAIEICDLDINPNLEDFLGRENEGIGSFSSSR